MKQRMFINNISKAMRTNTSSKFFKNNPIAKLQPSINFFSSTNAFPSPSKKIMYTKNVRSFSTDSTRDVTKISDAETNYQDSSSQDQEKRWYQSFNETCIGYKGILEFVRAFLGPIVSVASAYIAYLALEGQRKHDNELMRNEIEEKNKLIKKSIEEKMKDEIIEIEQKLASIVNSYNRDNASKKGVKNNNALLECSELFEQIAGESAKKEIKEYFEGKAIYDKEITLKNVLNLVNFCNDYATKEMYHNHVGRSARAKLEMVEKIFRKYLETHDVKTEGKEKVTAADATTEYLKGRSYIYDDENYEQAIKHFTKAKELAETVGTFEAHLSEDGLGIITDKLSEAELKAKNPDIDTAIKLIEENITRYKKLIDADTKYKMNYKSENNYETINPKEDQINFVKYGKKLIKALSLKATLISDSKEKQEITKEMTNLLKGGNNDFSLLNLIDEGVNSTKQLSDREKASSLNFIAQALVNFEKNNIDSDELMSLIKTKLSFIDADTEGTLNVAKALHEHASSISFEGAYTKSNADKGIKEIDSLLVANTCETDTDTADIAGNVDATAEEIA